MKLYTCLLTKNRCYLQQKRLNPVKGIMVHSTGANNPNIRRYVQPSSDDANREQLIAIIGKNNVSDQYGNPSNDWNNPNVSKCVHAFIGKLVDGSVGVVQTLPWDFKGWHAGTGTSGKSANDTHIAFEICEDNLSNKDYFLQTYEAAVDLVAFLCDEYSLDPLADGVVICHKEGYNRGIASQHADVLHWWPKFGVTMDGFRKAVHDKLSAKEEKDDMVYYKTYDDVPDYYKDAINACVKQGGLKGVNSEGDLNISEDYCRIMTTLYRMGIIQVPN